MCGIVGFTGKDNATDVLIQGLSRLEYRGYDSAGIAIQTEAGILTIKSSGGLQNLQKKLESQIPQPKARCGIGHTRWATHGKPTEENAHPHQSTDGTVTLVHNGIIENAASLRAFLLEQGYRFRSETDTEAAANLIAYHYAQCQDPIGAIGMATRHIQGSFALAILFSDKENMLFVTRRESPLIIGIKQGEAFVASDIPAILPHTHTVYHLDHNEIACLSGESVSFFHMDGRSITKQSESISWNVDTAEKNGFPYFMLKEIHEQPSAIRHTLSRYVKTDGIDFSESALDREFLKKIHRLHIVGCGSAYHVGLAAKAAFEHIASISVFSEYASEIQYLETRFSTDDVMLIISQSGETADSLAALRKAKEKGIKTLAIVNVEGSSIAKEADFVLYTCAGPEIAVATTKAYSAQLIVCYLLAIASAHAKGLLESKAQECLLQELLALPEKAERILSKADALRPLALRLSSHNDLYLIARGIDLATALEGALKIKEISYIHAEAYPAGELKHGTLSLIEENTPVIAILTQEALAQKTKNNLSEVKSRGAYPFAVCKERIPIDKELCDSLTLPDVLALFAPTLSVIPFQLLAYEIGIQRGLDVDKPRNLAKSVTVE